MIKIYTDGSCIGNPGNGGWAAIIIDNIFFNKGKFHGFIDFYFQLMIFYLMYQQPALTLYVLKRKIENLYQIKKDPQIY